MNNAIDFEALERLAGIVASAGISELTIQQEGFRVTLRKQQAAAPAPSGASSVVPVPASAFEDSSREPVPAPAPHAAEPFWIRAPMVGIFRPAEPALDTGNRVETGQTVGSIESMKLMNDVVSEVDGIVVEALVDDGMPVEYGQPLIAVLAAASQVEAR
jgi:acetyl-CoA carboxylase biotin carboxyl carrier protein